MVRVLAILLAVAALGAEDPLAEALYKKHCAQCHDQGGASRIPAFTSLTQFTPAAVNRSTEAAR